MQARRFPRFSVNQFLTAVVFWDDMPIRRVHGRCVVLGEGGLGAILADQLYLGDIVRLEMPPVPSLYATVRHAHGGVHGLEFLYSQDGQRQAIGKLCAAAPQHNA